MQLFGENLALDTTLTINTTYTTLTVNVSLRGDKPELPHD